MFCPLLLSSLPQLCAMGCMYNIHPKELDQTSQKLQEKCFLSSYSSQHPGNHWNTLFLPQIVNQSLNWHSMSMWAASYAMEKKKSSDNLEAGKSNNPRWSSDQELPFKRQHWSQSVPGVLIKPAPGATAQTLLSTARGGLGARASLSWRAQNTRWSQRKAFLSRVATLATYSEISFWTATTTTKCYTGGAGGRGPRRAVSSPSVRLSVRPTGQCWRPGGTEGCPHNFIFFTTGIGSAW